MISVRNLCKRFDNNQVLDGATLEIAKGETVVIFGPSGSGKTTLLRCLNGLEWADSGSVEVDGILVDFAHSRKAQLHKLRDIRKRCGFVFQQFNLFPHRNVLQNLTLAPLHVKQANREEAERLALELLEQVGLTDKAQQRPSRLSGGEQQRVAIARALAMEPGYLLYDEPTSSLDRERAREIWKIMRELAAEGQTQLVVTHQEELTREVPSRIMRMNAGRLVATEEL